MWRRGCFGWEYKGKHKNLSEAYQQLLGESPPTPVLLQGLGIALALQERYDEAFKHLRTALEQEDPKTRETGAYLKPSPGEASLNVLKMAREGLFLELRTALAEARSRKVEVRRQGVRVHGESETREIDLPASNGEISERAWRLSALAILLVGAFLRLVKLSLVPLHHDEGVNGNFLVSLVRNGTYTYDPQNYHGPTIYYFSAIIPWVARFFGGKSFADAHGLTTFNIRFVTAAFGELSITAAGARLVNPLCCKA